jgi:hypothetical protein
MTDYFPSKLAIGERFCNRTRERNLLKNNIIKGRHTVLISPRRYGKSSLVHQVVAELEMPFTAIDLFLAHDDKAIIKRVLQGISEAVSLILPPGEKFLQTVQNFFHHFKVTLAANSFSIDAAFDRGIFDPVDQIFNALCSLAKLAKDKKQHVLFFIDEFQDISSAQSSKSIQGAIRHVAQETSDITFVFSGSNRHLLLELFDDKSMPLYMLCDKMHLQRMSSQDYLTYIQKAARLRWGVEIKEVVFNQIMTCTELHPFYVNMLCNELWLLDKPPGMDCVFDAWRNCFMMEERRLVAELEKLTPNQQDVLKALATNLVTEPTGQRFLREVDMPNSSIRQIMHSLHDKDMTYKISTLDPAIQNLQIGQIRVLDPLLAFALRVYS